MKTSRIFILLLFLGSLIGAILTRATIYTRLLYLATFVIGGSWLWVRLSIAGLKLTRLSRSLRANVGDSYDENFEVTNLNPWLCPWVEIRDETDLPTSAGSRLLVGIKKRNKRSYLAHTWLTQRGAFTLGPTTLISRDPFGLFKMSKTFPAESKLVILPFIANVDSFPTSPGLLPGGKVVRQKALGITPHAAGIREYSPGDALRRIHWPTSARRQRLMVKEFDQDPQAEFWIFLDAEEEAQASLVDKERAIRWDGWMLGNRPDFEIPPSTIEYSVAIAASLAHYFIAQRRAVGLVAADQINIAIPADQSIRQEEKILETLAFVKGKGGLSVDGLVAAQAGQLLQGSSVVLITSSCRPEVMHAVDDLLRRNLHPTVVLLDAGSFGGSETNDSLVESLKNTNVPVCHITCGADLGTSLSGLSKNYSYQETNQWFTPSIP